MAKPKCCRYCVHLKMREGDTKLYKHRMYDCGYELPPLPDLPASVENHWGWRGKWPPEKALMTPEYGTDCKTFARK